MTEEVKEWVEKELKGFRPHAKSRADMLTECSFLLGAVQFAQTCGAKYEDLSEWWDNKIREICYNGTFGEEYIKECEKNENNFLV